MTFSLTWQNVDLSPKKLSEYMEMGQMLSEQMLLCSNDICSNENSFNTLYFKDSSSMAKCRFVAQKIIRKNGNGTNVVRTNVALF